MNQSCYNRNCNNIILEAKYLYCENCYDKHGQCVHCKIHVKYVFGFNSDLCCKCNDDWSIVFKNRTIKQAVHESMNKAMHF
jgi:hypothetical protein